MQLDTDLTGLAGVTLAVFTLVLRQRRVLALPWPQRLAVLAAVLLVSLVPVAGLSLAGVLRGFTGDLSVLTLVFLLLTVARTLSGCALVLDENREQALKTLAIAALLFYPLVLGFSPFDPYRLGYANFWFMLVLMVFAAWSALRYSILLAVGIALAVAAWSVGWYESPNLWDYLIDPWVGIYALTAQARNWWKQRKGTAHVRSEP
jgi:hypothetical protein